MLLLTTLSEREREREITRVCVTAAWRVTDIKSRSEIVNVHSSRSCDGTAAKALKKNNYTTSLQTKVSFF